MKILTTFSILVVFQLQLLTQHYITVGTGLSTIFYDSKDLDKLKETYNLVNGPNLGTLMKGFGIGQELRWEVGYRSFGRLGMAFLAGLQENIGRDITQYRNGESRQKDQGDDAIGSISIGEIFEVTATHENRESIRRADSRRLL